MIRRTTGMVAMVDAIFCMIAILVIMIVVLPRDPSKIGFLPRADAVLTCTGEKSSALEIIAKDSEQKVNTVPLGLRGSERVNVLRNVLTNTLAEFHGTIAHVRLIAAGPRFLNCHDVFSCAFSGLGNCAIPINIGPWQPNNYVVSFTLTYALEPSYD